jgi:hypothetical protein
MKRCLGLLLLSATAVAAETLTQPLAKQKSGRAYLGVENFQWEEFAAEDQLLKESGPVFSLGGRFAMPLSPTLNLLADGRLFYGEVDYDGAVIGLDGSSVPYNSETTYAGLEAEADLARPIPTRSGLTWSPFAGVGLRAWDRSLDTSGGSTGDFGYDEYWLSAYVSIGLEARSGRFFGRVQVLAPFYNRETVDLGNQGGPDEMDLEPGEEVSWGGEIGAEFNRYFVSLYVQTMKFSESDTDDETGIFYQPESDMQIIGLRAGMAFP